VNERKRLIARKQSIDPRIFCMVSRKMKRNEQHNPLSPQRKIRKEKERKETKKFEERKSKNVDSFINIDFDFSFLQVLQINMKTYQILMKSCQNPIRN
jgi:hypothetical protein